MIRVNSINLLGNEKKYISECIDTNWISGSGKFNYLFEKKIQN